MSKITFENKKGKITITNRLSFPETVNERVYNAIASGMFEGLLPVSIRQKRKETRIECVVQGLTPLSEYFGSTVNKKMFLDFIREITRLIKDCEKNMVSANNLDLQISKIFVDPQTKSVKCIFWPVVNNQRDDPPYLFLKQLPFDLRFNPYEDQEYLEIYKAFFNGLQPFSINSFEKMILKLCGKEIAGGFETPSNITPSGRLNSDAEAEKKIWKEKKKGNIEYDPFAEIPEHREQEVSGDAANRRMEKESNGDVVCPSCGQLNSPNAKYCMNCREKLDEPPPTIDFGTICLNDNFGGTVVLGYDEPREEPMYPKLKREQTGESFAVNKPTFRIGTEKKYCDLFICDNNYISRSHADIITREGRYYIVDRNSTNKTFVEDKAIPTEKEIEIFAGTRIRLANEDFTFHIET